MFLSILKRSHFTSLVRAVTACSVVMLSSISSNANYQSGNVWYINTGSQDMAGDWSGTVYITASNITFNMKGYSITGTGQPQGILIASGTYGVTIKGNDDGQWQKGYIANFNYGIINYASLTSIDNVSMDYIAINGIEERSASYLNITNCDIFSADRYGIAGLNTNFLGVYSTNVGQSGYDGIILNNCQNYNVSSGSSYQNSRHGIYLINSSGNVESTSLSYNGFALSGHGLKALDCPNTNYLTNNGVYYNSGYGFYRSNSPNTIDNGGNSFYYNGSGDKNW